MTNEADRPCEVCRMALDACLRLGSGQACCDECGHQGMTRVGNLRDWLDEVREEYVAALERGDVSGQQGADGQPIKIVFL